MRNVNPFFFHKPTKPHMCMMYIYVCNFVSMWRKVQKGTHQKGTVIRSTLGGQLKTKQKSRITCNRKTKISQDYKTWQTS